MKNFILKRLLTGCVTALFLAGCFNPSTGELPVKVVVAPPAPFSVEIEIGEDTLTARSLYDAARAAGPQAKNIMSLINNYANFAQLVMVDKNGVAYTGEVWKQEGKNAVFNIRRVNYSATQFFLLLMGHWDTENKAKKPTLLASGFSPWDPMSGSRKILVYMWPIQVQAELTTSALTERADGEKPMKYDDDKRVSELWPAKWGIEWTLKTEGEGDPLAPLIAAQETWAALGSSGTAIPDRPPKQGVWDDEALVSGKGLKVKNWLIKAKGTNTDGGKNTADDDFWEAAPKEWGDTHVLPLPVGGVSKVISWDMSQYTAGPEDQFNEGGVNFNLEYVPFNLTDGAAWTKWDGDSEFTLDGSGLPVWIIRGGLNDEAQDGNTTFDDLKTDSNGNGAAAFRVKKRYWVAEVDSAKRDAGYVKEGTELFTWQDPLRTSGWRYSLSEPISRQYSNYSAGNGMVYKSMVELNGFPLTASYIWDAYEGRVLTPKEGGYLLEWKIDWGTEESPNSGILDRQKALTEPGKAIRQDKVGMTSGTLTIETYEDISWKRLKFVGNLEKLQTGSNKEYYFITLRSRLPKGLTGDEDYTGGHAMIINDYNPGGFPYNPANPDVYN